MELKYRISSSRPDDPPRVIEEPSFEGDSLQDCDEKAVKRLEELATNSSYAWDNLSLARINVIENVTHIAINFPKNHTQGAERKTTFRQLYLSA